MKNPKFHALALRSAFAAIIALLGVAAVRAHDTWVQTNTNMVRVNDAIHIDLMLGNHGNEHRDYKLASKISLDSITTFDVVDPDGQKHDLKKTMVDLGLDPKEGFWSAKFVPTKPGMHVAAQTIDKAFNKKGKGIRAYRSAKSYFLATPSLDKVGKIPSGFDRPLGHRFELVAETNPVAPMAPGTAIKVKLLFEGKPMPDARVSFIPRGVALSEGFDKTYERMTDREGRANFTPSQANYYLVAAHHAATEEKGEGYASAHYSATLTVYVPQICPCCDDLLGK